MEARQKLRMRILLFFTICISCCACSEKKIEVSFFDNGRIKERAETVNNKKNGTSWEYDSVGRLKLKRSWKDGKLHGPFEAYYPNGKISYKGVNTIGQGSEMMAFYPSGKISEIYFLDQLGNVIDVSKFSEDGAKDRTAFPYFNLDPPGDTQKVGERVTLRVRMVNVHDSIYFGGRMVITSQLTKKPTNKLSHIVDTVALIYPVDSFTYLYKFIPMKIGHDTIKGELIFQRDLGDEIEIQTEVFAYPFRVVE